MTRKESMTAKVMQSVQKQRPSQISFGNANTLEIDSNYEGDVSIVVLD